MSTWEALRRLISHRDYSEIHPGTQPTPVEEISKPVPCKALTFDELQEIAKDRLEENLNKQLHRLIENTNCRIISDCTYHFINVCINNITPYSSTLEDEQFYINKFIEEYKNRGFEIEGPNYIEGSNYITIYLSKKKINN